MRQQILNIGELVVIRDFSYALRFGEGKPTNSGSCEPYAHQQFRVLVTGCDIPTYKLGDLQRVADTIVKGIEDDVVWVVHSALVEPIIKRIEQNVETRIMAELKCADGTVVQISTETEKELRKAFGGHEWVHGDVFVTCVKHKRWIYLKPNSNDPIVVELTTAGGGGTLECQLRGAEFLFNIKDKL